MGEIKNIRGRDISAPVEHITIDGQQYALKFSNQAARIAEDIYEQVYGQDIGFAEILSALSKFKYKAVMAMFYGAMVAGGTDIGWQAFDEKFSLSSVDGISEIIAKGVVDALPRAANDEDEAEAPQQTPTRRRATRGHGCTTEPSTAE